MAARTRSPDLVGLAEHKFPLAFGSPAAVTADCFQERGNREVPYGVVAAAAVACGEGFVAVGV